MTQVRTYNTCTCVRCARAWKQQRVETAARGGVRRGPGAEASGASHHRRPRARAPPHSHTGPKYYNTSTRYNIVLSCRGASNTARDASTRARARCQVSAIHGCGYSIASTEVWLHPKASCAPSVRRARARLKKYDTCAHRVNNVAPSALPPTSPTRTQATKFHRHKHIRHTNARDMPQTKRTGSAARARGNRRRRRYVRGYMPASPSAPRRARAVQMRAPPATKYIAT